MAVAFKDIGKAANDLLTKDLKVGKNTVELKTKVPQGITLTPSATKAGDKLDGSLKAAYSLAKGMDAEATLSIPKGALTCSFEAADQIMKGMTCKVEAEMPGAMKLSGALAEVSYKTGPFKCLASYELFKGDLKASGSGTMAPFTVGAECGYSTAKGLSKYTISSQFVQPDFTVSCKFVDDILGKKPAKTFSGAYYHKVSGDMQVGAEIAKVSTSPDVDLAFGCLYKLDKDTAVKGKVDSDGKLSASLKQKLSPLTLITLAAEIDTVNLNEGKHKFGMVMNLTP
jgi:voltage-dependent anion channel protein 2